jgi:hypothetical protein
MCNTPFSAKTGGTLQNTRYVKVAMISSERNGFMMVDAPFYDALEQLLSMKF